MAEASAEQAPAKKAAKKAPAKKSVATKTPAKKSAAKKAPAKKTPAKKAPARRTSARTEAPPRRESAGRASGAARAAREAVLDLTGKQPEAVTGLERTDDGWRVEVDVLELERIPSTTDVLATYEVTLDGGGEMQGCRRVRRFLRGSAGDE